MKYKDRAPHRANVVVELSCDLVSLRFLHVKDDYGILDDQIISIWIKRGRLNREI